MISTAPIVLTSFIDSSNSTDNGVEKSFWWYGNKITIIRDNYGVPHVFAGTKEGLAYGCGYAMAQDRLWQADLYRRQGYGSLAEFGLASINSDLIPEMRHIVKKNYGRSLIAGYQMILMQN